MSIGPNFFIVGAAKSGTTSLADYLGQHPEVFFSPLKEPFYFIPDAGYSEYQEYMALFKKNNGAIAIGEGSTGYLFCKKTPELLYNYMPKAKIIILLRNPTDMAYSYWKYMKRVGSEDKSFEEAISNKEIKRRLSEKFKENCTNWWASYIYTERAMYYEQVKRYLDIFPKEQIKIYIFEDFIKSPDAICRDIFGFLGVSKNFKPHFNVKNVGGLQRFEVIKKIANCRQEQIRKIVKVILPIEVRSSVREFLKKINTKKCQSMPLAPNIREQLKYRFKDDIQNLEVLIDRKIPNWYEPKAKQIK